MIYLPVCASDFPWRFILPDGSQARSGRGSLSPDRARADLAAVMAIEISSARHARRLSHPHALGVQEAAYASSRRCSRRSGIRACRVPVKKGARRRGRSAHIVIWQAMEGQRAFAEDPAAIIELSRVRQPNMIEKLRKVVIIVAILNVGISGRVRGCGGYSVGLAVCR